MHSVAPIIHTDGLHVWINPRAPPPTTITRAECSYSSLPLSHLYPPPSPRPSYRYITLHYTTLKASLYDRLHWRIPEPSYCVPLKSRLVTIALLILVQATSFERSPTFILGEDTHLVRRTIGVVVPDTACKYEFRRYLRSRTYLAYTKVFQ